MIDPAPLLDQARAAEARGRADEAVRLLGEAAVAAKGAARFDILLLRARTEATGLGLTETALATYWEARQLAARDHLPRLGEADLGIGMMMLELGRAGEGIEAVRRAARTFRREGSTYLRGCAESLLAAEALAAGDLGTAERHLEVAGDLLEVAGEPRMLSSCLTLRAECVARLGHEEHAEALLARAATLARHVADQHAQAELQQRRRAVRHVIAEALAAGLLPEPPDEE